MSKDKKTGGGAENGGGNVTQMNQCLAEKCSKKVDKMGFCKEHYGWFKEGLLTREGQRPPDFDKKYQGFLHRKKSA